MAKRRYGGGGNRQPALDIVSYGRRGPGHPERFTPEQIAQIARTVRRTPEVMVKVSGGGNTPGAVDAHFQYISRRGELELETGDGGRVQGKEEVKSLVDGWDLDLDALEDRDHHRRHGGRTSTPKLVHNIVLSMPARTPPDKLLAASRAFAREEFGLKHHYALALHTDQDHPHVHLVVRAHGYEGGRLNVRKSDLRRYREEFARHLRAQGVAANATPSQVRGKLSDHQRDGAYRAGLRHALLAPDERSMPTNRIADSSAGIEPASLQRIAETATAVLRDWRSVADTLHRQAMEPLAKEVEQYARTLYGRQPRKPSDPKSSRRPPSAAKPKQLEIEYQR